MATVPAAERPCPACGKPLSSGASRCAHCGVALGEHQRCVHCHAIADVEPAAHVRFVCSVCGGVRIPIDDPKVERSVEQVEHLKSVTAKRSANIVWKMIAAVTAGFGFMSLLVLSIVVSVAHPPTVAAVVATLAVLVPFALAVLAWRRSRARAAELEPLLEKAWMAAAADIARARGGELTASDLATITRIAEADADRLLGRMSAQSRLASSVTPEGNLKYTLLDAAAPPRSAALPLPE